VALSFAFLMMALAAFVKGAVGFGFPATATPLMALFLDGRTVIGVLILPNIVMDIVQAVRLPGIFKVVRRHFLLYLFGILGTFVGTKLISIYTPSTFLLVIGLFNLTFVGVNCFRISFSVPASLERLLGPMVGLGAGILGGMTNVPAMLLVIYFYALKLPKAEFVRSLCLAFLLFKGSQLVAVVQFGLMDLSTFGLSVLATFFALGTFWLGIKAQDRVDQVTFNKVVLGFLGVLGGFMVIRALSS
jgi:uncharacterized membrane protein YfcA